MPLPNPRWVRWKRLNTLIIYEGSNRGSHWDEGDDETPHFGGLRCFRHREHRLDRDRGGGVLHQHTHRRPESSSHYAVSNAAREQFSSLCGVQPHTYLDSSRIVDSYPDLDSHCYPNSHAHGHPNPESLADAHRHFDCQLHSDSLT